MGVFHAKGWGSKRLFPPLNVCLPLLAPYCAIPRDYLSDTPARYGVFGVSTWPNGCDTPSPFSECFPLGEHEKWRCDTPPQKGYLSDTCAIPFESKANGCDTPLCDTISKGCCAIWGGISHWAAKCLPWVSREGTWDVPGILPRCPALLGVFKNSVPKKFVLMFRPLPRRSENTHKRQGLCKIGGLESKPLFCSGRPQNHTEQAD